LPDAPFAGSGQHVRGRLEGRYVELAERRAMQRGEDRRVDVDQLPVLLPEVQPDEKTAVFEARFSGAENKSRAATR